MSSTISVIIPAHNEEKYIARCIHSIKTAAGEDPVEIIVACNRCTDHTADIATAQGARVVEENAYSIAKVRNAGIKAATSSIIVTIDADNRMTPGTLREIQEKLACGRFIGGGAPIRFERYSFALFLNDFLCRASFKITGLYCGMIWAEKKTFDEIGGFVDIKAMEDVTTAKKLKSLGKKTGLQYTTLQQNYLINSTRKFDEKGDWLYFKLLLKNAGTMVRAALGDRSRLDSLLDEMFYRCRD